MRIVVFKLSLGEYKMCTDETKTKLFIAFNSILIFILYGLSFQFVVLNVVVRENNNIFSSTKLIFRKLNITVRENSNIFIIISIINSLQV